MISKKNFGKWSSEEKEKFNSAITLYTNWKDIAEYIGTRNPAQCRSHNQKIEILKKKIYKYKKNVIKFKHKATQVDEIEIAIDTSPSFLW